MALFQPTSPIRYSYSPSLNQLKLTHYHPNRHGFLSPACLKASASGITTSLDHRLTPVIVRSSLQSLKPYIESQWQPILSGWLCSSISVYSLSQIVPRVGNLSEVLNKVDALRLRNEVLVLGALVLVSIITRYLQQVFLWEATLNCVYQIRSFVYQKVLQRDLGFFEGENGVSAGDIAYRITAEASDLADTLYSMLNTIVPCTLQLLAMAAQMLVISPILSLVSALVIPLMVLIVGHLGEKLRQISNEAHLTSASLSAYLNEVLPSILFVKASSAELCETIRFQSLASGDLSACLGKKKLKALIPQIVQILYSGVLFLICAGSLVLSGGSFDCSSLISFVTSLYLVIDPIQLPFSRKCGNQAGHLFIFSVSVVAYQGIGKAYNELKQGEPAVDRLFSLTRFTSKVIEKPDSVDLDNVHGDVEFFGICFKYGESRHLILNGLYLHIKAGETVALVGPSGGGKTTLVKLLLRLYDPLDGKITIDGCDTQKIRLGSLRRHVGLVSQETMLFSGTVAENIGYRDLTTGIGMERVKLAARTANADEFIETLPHQYQTNIGPRGTVLSGGQKQRLSIARAVYQNPSILILDEATSALDSRSETLVRQALQRLMQNRTVLVVAHRLETVLMADRILILEDGMLHEISRESLVDAQNTSMTKI